MIMNHQREKQLKATITPLIPPCVLAEMKSVGHALSTEAQAYVTGDGAVTLADAARSVVSQWSDYDSHDKAPVRSVRTRQSRLLNGGIIERENILDAYCFMCGVVCAGAGFSDRFECLQGGWVSSCCNHLAWGMVSTMDCCIYGCDPCVHDVYHLCHFRGDTHIRMKCGCAFLADSITRVND